MRYTVVWKSAAENQLTRLWTASAERRAITAAAEQIDRLLQTDPQDQGESRSGALRVLLIAPLGVDFLVDERNRTVFVLRTWTVTKRRS